MATRNPGETHQLREGKVVELPKFTRVAMHHPQVVGLGIFWSINSMGAPINGIINGFAWGDNFTLLIGVISPHNGLQDVQLEMGFLRMVEILIEEIYKLGCILSWGRTENMMFATTCCESIDYFHWLWTVCDFTSNICATFCIATRTVELKISSTRNGSSNTGKRSCTPHLSTTRPTPQQKLP